MSVVVVAGAGTVPASAPVGFTRAMKARGLLSSALAAASAALFLPASAPAEPEPIVVPVAFSGSGGFELFGELTIPPIEPSGRGYPAVLLLPGSGPTDRDGNQLPALRTDLLKQISDRLVADGFATLRFDKRAVPARYGAKFPTQLREMRTFFSWEAFVRDVVGATTFLANRPEVDASRIGIFGHSEGALLALEAVQRPGMPATPRALVLAAGPGRPMGEILREQLARSFQRMGMPAANQTEILSGLEQVVRVVRHTSTLPRDMHPALRPLFAPYIGLYMQGFLGADPIDLARRAPGSVLVVQGSADIQISAERDARPLFQALRSRPSRHSQLKIVPGASHNFKAVSDPDKEPGFAGPSVPEFLDGVSQFLRAQL
ncbi:MAG: hypothetical protein SNJ76_10820 [Fimbriimonadaceae bacterium]